MVFRRVRGGNRLDKILNIMLEQSYGNYFSKSWNSEKNEARALSNTPFLLWIPSTMKIYPIFYYKHFKLYLHDPSKMYRGKIKLLNFRPKRIN